MNFCSKDTRAGKFQDDYIRATSGLTFVLKTASAIPAKLDCNSKTSAERPCYYKMRRKGGEKSGILLDMCIYDVQMS